MEIIIDDRENSVIQFINEAESRYTDIKFTIKRLEIGDYIIMFGELILAVIERKTWKDLAASIKDGRSNNVEKLLLLREKTNCIILYIIEGSANPTASNYNHVPTKNLIAHLDHLIIRDNIHIIYSKTEAGILSRLSEFARHYETINANKIKKINNEILTKREPPSELKIKYDVWCSLPYVASNTAGILMGKYTIKDFINGKIPVDEIATLQFPTGNIIGGRANNIVKNAGNLSLIASVKLLSSIPLISRGTAHKLMYKYNNVRALYELTFDELANFQKTPQTKLGKKAAMNMIKYLEF